MVSGSIFPARLTQVQTPSNDKPPCLENSRRAAPELSSLTKTATLHFRLNQDNPSPELEFGFRPRAAEEAKRLLPPGFCLHIGRENVSVAHVR